MVDTVKTTIANENDDWEVAVDTGEFDKRLEQQEKDRAATQESISSTVNDDDNQNSLNLIKSNKPIRILKRPTSQSQLPVINDINNISQTSPFSNEISSSTTVPSISIIPRNQIKDSTNSSQTINSLNTSSTSQSTKPAIKTYEQRELEYRLARLRIMGEEESSAKDDDDDNDNPPTITLDETSKITFSSQSSLQSHSTPGSYAANLYTLNNTSLNTGAIHFTPNTGPFSQQQYPGIYPPIQLPGYPTATVYISSSSNYPVQPSSNPWYHYQQQQTPYGTQQYGHPQ